MGNGTRDITDFSRDEILFICVMGSTPEELVQVSASETALRRTFNLIISCTVNA